MKTITIKIQEIEHGAVQITIASDPDPTSTKIEVLHCSKMLNALNEFLVRYGSTCSFSSPVVEATGPNAHAIAKEVQEKARSDFNNFYKREGE